jgi:hypothetical protein
LIALLLVGGAVALVVLSRRRNNNNAPTNDGMLQNSFAVCVNRFNCSEFQMLNWPLVINTTVFRPHIQPTRYLNQPHKLDNLRHSSLFVQRESHYSSISQAELHKPQHYDDINVDVEADGHYASIEQAANVQAQHYDRIDVNNSLDATGYIDINDI